MDHATVNDLFEKFLSTCRQIDEPEIGRVLEKIRGQFEEVDSSYRESVVFKRLLQKVIRNTAANPWESMQTIAEDLRYHTFQADTESNQCSRSSSQDAVLGESLNSTSPRAMSLISTSPRTDSEWSSPSLIEHIIDFIRDGITGSSSSEASVDEEFSQSSDCGFGGSSNSINYTDAEDSQSSIGSSDESVYYDSKNCSTEVDGEGNHESHESDADNREHDNQNEFAVEDFLSRVHESFDQSMYDEAERIHLEALAKTNKYQTVQNLKMELTKLNLDISKMGNHEVRALSDGITSTSKVRSLMGKYLDVYMRICKLNNETTRVKDVIQFEGTKNVVIDRAIEKFYNERDDINLPLLDEMCDVIKNIKNDNGESLNLSESKVLEIAIDALQELGRIRRKQRADEFHDLLLSYSPIGNVCDPASLNPKLRMKLSENDKPSLERMDLIIEKFENRESIRTSRRSSLRRRSIADSLVELDVGDYLRSMLFPSGDGDE